MSDATFNATRRCSASAASSTWWASWAGIHGVVLLNVDRYPLPDGRSGLKLLK
jgi:hypothetical protein